MLLREILCDGKAGIIYLHLACEETKPWGSDLFEVTVQSRIFKAGRVLGHNKQGQRPLIQASGFNFQFPPHSRHGQSITDSLAQSSGCSEASHGRVPGSVLKMKPTCHSKPCLTSHITYEEAETRREKGLGQDCPGAQGPRSSELCSTPPYVPHLLREQVSLGR